MVVVPGEVVPGEEGLVVVGVETGVPVVLGVPAGLVDVGRVVGLPCRPPVAEPLAEAAAVAAASSRLRSPHRCSWARTPGHSW